MKSIAFLGAKSVGFECLKILQKNQEKGNYSVDAVFVNMSRNVEINKKLMDFAISHGVKVYDDIEEILNLPEFDFIVSVQYHQILKKKHIARARELAINLHMAPLPEYRGCNQFSYALINNSETFGTTIHVMDERIDHGDIIVENRFRIPENCFVDDLFEMTSNKSVELFESSIVDILAGNYKKIPQSELVAERGTMIGYRKDIQKLKQIDLSWDKEKIEAHIRATLMPGFDPPYFMIGDTRINITMDTKEEESAMTNGPEIMDIGIKDVEFGQGVKIIQPVNIYGAKIGDNCFVGPFVEIQKDVVIGDRTRVQSHSFICELVTIGTDCFIAHSVVFINDSFATGSPARANKALWKETYIGNNVSIGSNATILPVKICDNVVIGAGAVVTKDITEPGIYVGNPAMKLR